MPYCKCIRRCQPNGRTTEQHRKHSQSCRCMNKRPSHAMEMLKQPNTRPIGAVTYERNCTDTFRCGIVPSLSLSVPSAPSDRPSIHPQLFQLFSTLFANIQKTFPIISHLPQYYQSMRKSLVPSLGFHKAVHAIELPISAI